MAGKIQNHIAVAFLFLPGHVPRHFFVAGVFTGLAYISHHEIGKRIKPVQGVYQHGQKLAPGVFLFMVSQFVPQGQLIITGADFGLRDHDFRLEKPDQHGRADISAGHNIQIFRFTDRTGFGYLVLKPEIAPQVSANHQDNTRRPNAQHPLFGVRNCQRQMMIDSCLRCSCRDSSLWGGSGLAGQGGLLHGRFFPDGYPLGQKPRYIDLYRYHKQRQRKQADTIIPSTAAFFHQPGFKQNKQKADDAACKRSHEQHFNHHASPAFR